MQCKIDNSSDIFKGNHLQKRHKAGRIRESRIRPAFRLISGIAGKIGQKTVFALPNGFCNAVPAMETGRNRSGLKLRQTAAEFTG